MISQIRHIYPIVIAIAAAAIFVPGLTNGPLGDDLLLLNYRLPELRATGLLSAFTEDFWVPIHTGGLYRPFWLLVLWIQGGLFGEDLRLFHTVGVALHAISAILIYRLLRRLHWQSGAMAGSLVFALHPIHTEAVLTVAGQADLWATVLALGALHISLPKGGTKRQVICQLCAAILFLCALGFKESVITLPLLAICVEPFTRQTPSSAPSLTPPPPHRKHWMMTYRPGFVLGIAWLPWLIIRYLAIGIDLTPASAGASVDAGGTLAGWWKLVLVTVGTYIRLLVFPYGQSVYYGHLREQLTGVPWLSLLALFTISLVFKLMLQSSARRGALLGMLWLLLGILPVANVIPIGLVVAERCLYWPSIGLCFILADLWDAIVSRAQTRRYLYATGTMIVILCLLQTIVTVLAWRTPLSHWAHTVQHHPDSPKAHAVLGLELLLSGDIDRARFHITKASSLNPDSPDALLGLAEMCIDDNRMPDARRLLQRAHQFRPTDPVILNELKRLENLMSIPVVTDGESPVSKGEPTTR